MARKELDGRWGGRPVESGQGSASSVALEPDLLPQTQLIMWSPSFSFRLGSQNSVSPLRPGSQEVTCLSPQSRVLSLSSIISPDRLCLLFQARIPNWISREGPLSYTKEPDD